MTVVQHTVGLNRRITISINKFIKSFCQYNACYDVTAMFAVAAHHVTSEQTVIMCLRVHVFTCLRKYPPPLPFLFLHHYHYRYCQRHEPNIWIALHNLFIYTESFIHVEKHLSVTDISSWPSTSEVKPKRWWECVARRWGRWWLWVLLAGRKLISGPATRRPRTTHVLGVRLLHSRYHVNGRLWRHRLRQSNRTILHGLFHPWSFGLSHRSSTYLLTYLAGF